MSRSDSKRTRGDFARSILRDARSLRCFFVALLIIELLYTVLFFAVATDAKTVRREVTDRYDYEIEFRSMTQPQYASLYNQCGEVPPEDEIWRPYSYIRYEQVDDQYNAYVTLRGSNTPDAEAYFNYLYTVEGVTPTRSPLYAYRADYLPDIIGFTLLCTLGVLAVSLLLLMRLYRMRMDRDTFAFGIYMTCGATFSRLYSHAVSELLLVGALTLLPALLLGLGITALLYALVGVSVSLSPWALLLVLAFSALTILLAAFIPMKRLSRKAPVELLHAKDNSPYVTSPRRSFRIFGAAYPRSYELISLWRYRRYYAWLLVATVLLPVLLVATCTLSDVQHAFKSATAPDFTVTFSPEKPNAEALLRNTAELADAVAEIEGVDYCLLTPIETSATSRVAHLLIPRTAAVQAGSVSVPYRRVFGHANVDEYAHATNLYTYTALDEAAIASLEAQYSDIEGDLRSVLQNDHTVIVTDSMGNTSPFGFSVGDVLLISVEAEGVEVLSYTSALEVLDQQLQSGSFAYEEYTVGAVIHDARSDATLMLGVGFDAYVRLTESEPCRNSFDIYLEKALDLKTWQSVSRAVYDAAYDYYHCTVDNHNVCFERYLTTLRSLEGRTLVLALSFGLMALLVAFYSQHVFYEKRKTEWMLLRSFGTSAEQHARLFALSAVCLAAVSAVLTLPLSLLCHHLICRAAYEWLPGGGFLARVTAQSEVPRMAVLAALAISLVCGLVPPLVAHLRYCRTQNPAIGGDPNVSEER